jgi:hypothetical protein
VLFCLVLPDPARPGDSTSCLPLHVPSSAVIDPSPPPSGLIVADSQRTFTLNAVVLCGRSFRSLCFTSSGTNFVTAEAMTRYNTSVAFSSAVIPRQYFPAESIVSCIVH